MGAWIGTSHIEALYYSDGCSYQDPDELFELISQVMLSAVDRDALSGWGCQVKIYTEDKIITKILKARTD